MSQFNGPVGNSILYLRRAVTIEDVKKDRKVGKDERQKTHNCMLDLQPIHHPQAHPTPPPRPKQAISIQTITSLVVISHVYDKK